MLMAIMEDGDQGDDFRWDSARVWAASGFQDFLDAHGISRSDLLPPDGSSASPQRFFRLKQTPRGAPDAQEAPEDRTRAVLVSVAEDLRLEGHPATPERVPWLDNFYSLPASAPLARVGAYRRGDVYGVDTSSGYCVALLDLQPGEHVLDLCCAPGAKLALAADRLGLRGSVTGVDCSRQRLNTCKQLVHKYQLLQPASCEARGGEGWRCRLFCADGRSFSVGPAGEPGDGVELVLDSKEVAARGPHGQLRKRMNKSARARERKRQRLAVSIGEGEEPGGCYDEVLVDAECTHDGSVRHLQRLRSLDDWRAYVSTHLSDEQVNRILKLQHDLIRNGFRMVRPGGVMVYSTCSLSVQQNERVVESFLSDHDDARLEAIDRTGIPCQEGGLPGTVRFTPANSTSGLFIAKIRRREASEPDKTPPLEAWATNHPAN